MRRVQFVLVTGVTAVVMLGSVRAAAAAEPDTAPAPLPDAVLAQLDTLAADAAQGDTVRAIIDLTPSTSVAEFDAALGSSGTVTRDLGSSQVAVALDAAGVAAVRDSAHVVDVTIDELVAPDLTQSTEVINATDVAAGGTAGAGTSIAILDTGVQSNHPFLAGKVIAEACFAMGYNGNAANGSGCPNNHSTQTGVNAARPCDVGGCNHGTHVAGIAAGRATGGFNANGVAPGASVVAVQVFSEFPAGEYCGVAACPLAYSSDVIAALNWVNSVRDTYAIASANLSLGGGAYDKPCYGGYETAIATLRASGVAVSVSAGNSGYTSSVGSPGCSPSATTVGATTKADELASYSNSAWFVDVLAPGSSITSSVTGSQYAAFSGTSMAAPHVAGAFAVLRAELGAQSVDAFEQRLRTSGHWLCDARNQVAFARIDLAGAVAGAGATGAPCAPGNVSAASGVTSATVSWSTPAATPTPMTMYRVVASSGQIVDVAGSATSTTMSDLAPGVGVSFSVYAWNGSAFSPAATSAPVVPAGVAAPAAGYWVATADARVMSYGTADLGANTPLALARPVIGMDRTPSGKGVWLAASDGGIFTYGDAVFHGSTGAILLNQPIVAIARTPSGHGYWLAARDGGIFAFGDAQFYGSTGGIRLNQPIVGMAATPSGHGYWLVASDGGMFAFGDAQFYGSTGGIRLNQPIVAMTPNPTGSGYWLIARDGGVFAFGESGFYGSTGAMVLNQPIVGAASTPSGHGYWFVAADGGIFSFGDATFKGASTGVSSPVVGLKA